MYTLAYALFPLQRRFFVPILLGPVLAAPHHRTARVAARPEEVRTYVRMYLTLYAHIVVRRCP